MKSEKKSSSDSFDPILKKNLMMLLDFRGHDMICGSDHSEVSGFTAKNWVADLSSSSPLASTFHSGSFTGAASSVN